MNVNEEECSSDSDGSRRYGGMRGLQSTSIVLIFKGLGAISSVFAPKQTSSIIWVSGYNCRDDSGQRNKIGKYVKLRDRVLRNTKKS